MSAHSSDVAGVIVFLVTLAGMGLFMLAMLALTAFWIWMVIDRACHEPSTGNDKIVWLLIILLLNWIGALIYFFVRRMPRRAGKLP